VDVTDGQGTKYRRNIAENFNRLNTAHERYRRHTTDRQTDRQTDRRATANGERERWVLPLAKNGTNPVNYTVYEKTATLFFGHNFGKWTPSFTILSLLDFAGNFLQICYRDFHLTLDVLLYYLAKSEIQYIRVLKTVLSSSHIFSQTAIVCNIIFSNDYLLTMYIFLANNDITRYAIVLLQILHKMPFWIEDKHTIKVLRQQKLYGATNRECFRTKIGRWNCTE